MSGWIEAFAQLFTLAIICAAVYRVVSSSILCQGLDWLDIIRRPRLVVRVFEVPLLVLFVSVSAFAWAGEVTLTLVEDSTVARAISVPWVGRTSGAVAFGLLHTLPLIAAMLAIRWVSHQRVALVLAALCSFGGIAGIFCCYLWVAQALAAKSPPWGEADRVAIPVLAALSLRFTLTVIALLSALVGFALIPRAWAFVAAGFLGGQLATYLSRAGIEIPTEQEFKMLGPIDHWRSVVVPAIANALLVAGIWSLPRQRQALLSVAGLSEGPPGGPRLLLLRSGFVALTAGFLIAMKGMAAIEHRAIRVLFEPQEAPRSPSQINAWGALEPHFDSLSRDWHSWGKHAVANLAITGKLHLDPEKPQDFRAIASPQMRASFAREQEMLAPIMADWSLAGRADYLRPVVTGDRRFPHLHLFRISSDFLAIRSRLRCLDGDWQGALSDIESILRLSALEVDGPLQIQMIMTAARRKGCEAGAFFWYEYREKPEAVMAMRSMLESALGNRRSFPFDTLKRYEPTFTQIYPTAELGPPAYYRATMIYQRTIGQFDMLRVAFALEEFRHEKGSYAERLDALVPEYLAVLPPDPFDGKPFIYSVTDEALVLTSERQQDPESIAWQELFTPLHFPFPE
jgi:hypothetical protein